MLDVDHVDDRGQLHAVKLLDLGRGTLDRERRRQRRRLHARGDRVDRERPRGRDLQLVVRRLLVIVVVGADGQDLGPCAHAGGEAELEVVIFIAAPLLGRAARLAQLGRELGRRHQQPVAMRAAHQGFLKFARRLVARRGIDRERLGHDRVEVRRQPGHLARHLRNRLRVDLVSRGGQPGRDEQALPGEDLVHAHRDRVEIAAVVERLAPRLLGRHVADLALDLVEQRRMRRRLRDAEVGQLDLALVRQQHVRRRDITMDQLERVAIEVALRVSVRERGEHLARDVDRRLR